MSCDLKCVALHSLHCNFAKTTSDQSVESVPLIERKES